ncbi:hypothetical protein B0H14DRAFT_2608976 [Mycena olivaceomarginata]|nr:hypothetical protein B0H14DRAFT_2608976 [Mycena olivaceomarginata]
MGAWNSMGCGESYPPSSLCYMPGGFSSKISSHLNVKLKFRKNPETYVSVWWEIGGRKAANLYKHLLLALRRLLQRPHTKVTAPHLNVNELRHLINHSSRRKPKDDLIIYTKPATHIFSSPHKLSMPKNKWSSKAKNLGAFAVKRKPAGPPDSSEDNDTSHISEAIGADVGSDPHDSESEDDNEIEIQEENDIPHPRDHADLLSWLQISDTHLNSLHTSAAPACRGSYHSSKNWEAVIGAEGPGASKV